MPRCIALKSDLRRCTSNAHGEGERCRTHQRIHEERVRSNGPLQAGKCHCWLTTGRWCSNDHLENDVLCTRHARKRDEAETVVRRWQEDIGADIAFWNTVPRPTWQHVMDTVIADETRDNARRYRVARWYFGRFLIPGQLTYAVFEARWTWAAGGRVGPEPVAPAPGIPIALIARAVTQPTLGAIATDRQNVHTTAVTQQTNAGLEKILKAKVPKTQDTQAILTQEWLFNLPVGVRPAFNTYLQVINDVNKWFVTKTCRTTNDRLYYNVLRGVVCLVNQTSGETRAELYKRLWEECSESVGMCCDGHITRLCNVFVGFDEVFAPPVPFGEILQNKMAAIALQDIEEEEKKRLANAFFDEYAIPVAERVAWLESF